MKLAADFRKAGIKNIACLSVNDPFVMQGWGESVSQTLGIENTVDMIADPDGKIAKVKFFRHL